jgi:hypothetical protein
MHARAWDAKDEELSKKSVRARSASRGSRKHPKKGRRTSPRFAAVKKIRRIDKEDAIQLL